MGKEYPDKKLPHRLVQRASCVYCHEVRQDMLTVFLVAWMVRHPLKCPKQPVELEKRSVYRIAEGVKWL